MSGDSARSDKSKDPQEQQEARDLAEKSGVPLWGAYRVIRGELTLNDLLKSMMRREKFKTLKSQHGLDADLAGHVANDSLPIWRAKLLQDMRGAGRSKFTRDRISIAHSEKLAVAVWCFGADEWIVGNITRCRTYDFDFKPTKGAGSKIHKHNIKALCHPNDVEAIDGACGVDAEVRALGLQSSKSREERYRPADQQLKTAKSREQAVKWVFRDGSTLIGNIFAFGRWDLDLLTQGSTTTLFFHALHVSTNDQFDALQATVTTPDEVG
jgi:hypothetical protein